MNIKHNHLWFGLTVPIAFLLAIAAGSGVFITDLYRDAPFLAAQAIGQDYISLAVVLPALIFTALVADRDSPRARMFWLGVLIYLVYTYAIAAFAVKFNRLFLIYVSLLGFSLYALIGGLVTTRFAEVRECFAEKTPAKTVSAYLAVLALLFYGLWLSEIIPALTTGAVPQSVLINGTPTNAVHVLDMAWILPAFGIAAVSLWRRQGLGYILAGAILTYIVLLALAILSMILVMKRQGQPVIESQVVVFVILFAVSLGMLIWYLKTMKCRATL
jgi:hypothetical protein